MKAFEQDKFDDFILENGIIGLFEKPLKLKSGRLSHWYVNWRTAAEDVFLTDKLTDYVIDFAKDKKLNPDTFYGVPEGASKLGILTQFKWAKSSKKFAKHSHALAMGRGKEKDHGDPKDKHFLAMPKGKTIVIEDVTSTGSSLIDTINKLKNLGIAVVGAIALTNRNELTPERKTVEETLKKQGVPYFAMSNALTLLPKMCKRLACSKEAIKSIELGFKEFGAKPIKLS